ncbi:MAG: TetR/AcrR family transcriptional regulator [Bacteroidales bacterium]|jgi:AcrR family transcriptional regulator|nr:TetR/AcrR family transcriptional regulator [Bacteroidales bacterium]
MKKQIELKTEEKIKEAARTMFLKKGFAATKTRDIAEESGINLALLNYYFRSKEKLFKIIIMETLKDFFESILSHLNDEATSLEEKFDTIVVSYITLLQKNPDMPLFVLGEMQRNKDQLLTELQISSKISNSYLIKQLQQAIKEGKIAPVNPMHIIINLIGLTVFPFAAKPMVMEITQCSDSEFTNLMEERKDLISKWLKEMMYIQK